MKQLFIVANWKSYKTEIEVKEWLQRFKIQDLRFKNKEVIICSPYTSLSTLHSLIMNHESLIRLGAQDISPYGEGAYTGEVNGKQIKEFCDYVIIGHSERRKYFGESEEIIKQKLDMAQKYGLTPILCISNLEQIKNYTLYAKRYTLIVAYEPLFAIGTGIPDTPENANKITQKIKEICNVPVIYGGSVKEDNVKSFISMEYIDGVLVGGASLRPQEFLKIITNA